MQIFAQRVIVGEVCIDIAHKPTVAVFKTNALQNGHPSYLTPCQKHISFKEKVSYGGEHRPSTSAHLSSYSGNSVAAQGKLGSSVFMRTEKNDKPALSFEDETFLEVMEKEFHRDEKKQLDHSPTFQVPQATPSK